MGHKLRQDRTEDGDAHELIEADINRSYQRITQVPVAIVLCVDIRDMHYYSDRSRKRRRVFDDGAKRRDGGANLLLAARAEGLGACIMFAPLFCPDVVIESLQLPQA